MDDRIASELVRELAETNELLRTIQQEVAEIRSALRLQRMLQIANRPGHEPQPDTPPGVKRQA